MKNAIGHKVERVVLNATGRLQPHGSPGTVRPTFDRVGRGVSPSRNFSARAGFSLLELLSAMAILMIIVMMMGVIFAEGDRIWTIGTNRVDNNSYGRAALNMIAHDLQYAVADNVLTFEMRPNRPSEGQNSVSYDYQNSEVCAVSLQHDSADSNRTAREVHYYVTEMTNTLGQPIKRYCLIRGYWSGEIVSDSSTHSYHNKTWYEDTVGRPPMDSGHSGVIAENVSAFYASYGGVRSFFSTDTHLNPLSGVSESNTLPEYVDICLEILNERPARQAAELWDRGNQARAKEIVDRNQRRYTERVFFHNRYGYKTR